jgi:HEAT repeat protein
MEERMSPISQRFPIPTNDDDFERLCRDVLRLHWSRPGLEIFGKRGERQFGIDLLDLSGQESLYAAQCKLKEEHKSLLPGEIETEVNKAKLFIPRLQKYGILTTGKVSTHSQRKIRELNQAHKSEGLFEIELFTWEKLCELIQMYPGVHEEHYGEIATGRGVRIEKTVIQVQQGIAFLISRVDGDEINEARDPITRADLAKLTPDLIRLTEGELHCVLLDAERRLGKAVKNWDALDRLFVPIKVAQGPRPKLREADYQELEQARQRGEYKWLRDLEEERLDLRRQEEQGRLHRKVVEWLDVRSVLKQVVLLGDPGYGKTMLLGHEVARRNYAASAMLRSTTFECDELDIAVFVRAVDLAKRVSKGPGIREAVIALLASRHDLKGEARRVVSERLQTGHCLVAVDALDEVPWAWRVALNTSLDEFVRKYPSASVLVSSRLTGYVHSPALVGEGDELEVLAFEEHQMESAVKGWFSGERKAGEQLWRHIESQGRVKEELRCPLSLRLACQVGEDAMHKGEALPRWERRTKLYKTFLENAVGRWAERAEPCPTREQRGLFLGFVGDLALNLWLLDARRTVWEAHEVSRAVDSARRGYRALSVRQDLLEDVCEAGILVLAGPDEPLAPLMFSHRTFGEYLAASALAEKAGLGRLNWTLIDKKAWDPDWEQVMSFFAGRCNREQVLRLLELLADEKTDDLFRHRLGLVAQCLGEISRKVRDEIRPTIDQITTAVFECWQKRVHANTEKTVSHLTRRFRILVVVNETIRQGRFLAQLRKLLRDSEPAEVRSVAAEALGDLGEIAAVPEILAALLEMASPNSRSIMGHEAAVGALGKIGRAAGTPEVIAGLLALLGGHRDFHLKCSVARALPRMTNPEIPGLAVRVVEALVEALTGPMDRDGRDLACWDYAKALGLMRRAAARPEVLQRLLDRLLSALGEEDPNLSRALASALAEVGEDAGMSEIISRLSETLYRPDENTRSKGAQALGTMGSAAATPGILDRLLELLSDPDDDVRSSAAEALGNLGKDAAKPEVLARLVDLLCDRESMVSIHAASALRDLGGAAAPEILGRLLQMLRDPGFIDREFRFFGPPDYKALQVEVQRHWYRREAASALEKMGNAALTPDILARLTELMWDAEPHVRCNAATALLKMGGFFRCPEILGRINELICDPHWFVRHYVVKALQEVGGAAATQEIVVSLWQLLRDPDESTRSHAVQALRSLGGASVTPEILEHISGLLREPDVHLVAEVLPSMGRAALTPQILSGLPKRFSSLVDNILKKRSRHSTDVLETVESLVEVLGTVSSAAAGPEIVPRLLRLLRDSRFGERLCAASCVSRLSQAGVRIFKDGQRWRPRQVDELARLEEWQGRPTGNYP